MKKIFPHTGDDFSGLHDARDWLRENGAPIGAMKGNFDISKWRNMTRDEQQELDGTIKPVGGTFRDSDAIVELREPT